MPQGQPQSPSAVTAAPRHLHYSHEAMVDLILQEPTVTNQELAELFNLTPGWVSRVIAADSFQARLAERKAQLIDPMIAQTLDNRLKSVAIQSLELVGQKLDAEQSAAYALDALGMAQKGLGLGKHGR